MGWRGTRGVPPADPGRVVVVAAGWGPVWDVMAGLPGDAGIMHIPLMVPPVLLVPPKGLGGTGEAGRRLAGSWAGWCCE